MVLPRRALLEQQIAFIIEYKHAERPMEQCLFMGFDFLHRTNRLILLVH
jgi:hypothetical protein